jgi:uncharacterized small protein (DUF1192 family)
MDQPDGPVTRAEFRQEIVGLELRLFQRVGIMQSEIEQRMGLMQTEIEQRMGLMQTQIEEHTTERTRDMQTEVIRVFMEFQQRNESRDGSLDKATAGLSERLGMVERRLFQIERKLLLEPPAA